MISIGFRLKLLLAMLMVVGLTTAISLMVSLKRAAQANDRLFRVQVQEQLGYLPKEQADRLSDVQKWAGQFTRREAVQIALEERDANRLYELAWQHIAPVLSEPFLQGFGKKEKPPASSIIHVPKARFRMAATHLVFMGEQGEFLLPDEPVNGYFQSRNQREFRDKLYELATGLIALDKWATGYLSLGSLSGNQRLLEVVCLPVEQMGGGRKVGTLIMGFPAINRRGEKTLNEVSALHSGVWVDGTLLSTAIPEINQAQVAKWLENNAQALKDNPAENQTFLELKGIPYKVFVAPMDSHPPFPRPYKVGLYDWTDALAVKSDIKAQILGIGAVMGLLAVGLSWLISLGLFRPVRRLYRATMRLRDGDYDVRIPVRSSDELGKLAEAFNETAQELSLKNKYRDVLNKVTDKVVAERLIQGKVALGGKTRQMTVLFCDIRQYTEITQDLSPEETVNMLNEHMTAMTRVVHENGGVVDKFVGDMVMAVFGATETDPTAAERAVACARSMLSERKILNMLTGQEINVGVGVATGKMLAGFMGSEDRLNFTVIGKGANLASRLCTVAGPMDILVDEATCEAAREGRSAEPLPPMEIKGFHDLQAVYRICSEYVPNTGPENVSNPAL
ncbi:MAG TPA: hypothetical protein DEB48_12835 [Verrucomicrobiales bacterium]|nr:hypothetical protein [Verrucomicrobiales bacterium]